MNDQSHSSHSFIKDVWPLLLASLLLWVILPSLYFGNLHTDTLEAAYWGRDLALGYSKHPPFVSWLIEAILVPGLAPILTFLVLGQMLAILSAWYVYDLVGTIAGRSNAIMVACLMMVTSVATFYAPQVNHNSVLVPFCAAAMAYGYHFLEKRRLRDAIGLGLATGLGLLTKYEIIFALTPLLALSLTTPRFRSVYLSPKAGLAALIAASLVSPHLYWLSNHGWTSISRAVGSAPMNGIAAALFSLWGLFIGFVAVIAFPAILILMSKGRKAFASPGDQAVGEVRRLGQIFLIVPLVSVGLASLVTSQFIKALWLLPLTPSCIIGLALLTAETRNTARSSSNAVVTQAIKLTAVIALLFQLYLLASEWIDQPVESYLADTRPVSEAAQKLWSAHSDKPLSCIVSDEGKLSISPVLWIASRPQILPVGAADWVTKEHQEACTKSGAIAVKFVFDGSLPFEPLFPNACLADAVHLHVGSVMGVAKSGWEAELIYIPPADHPDCRG